MPHAFTWNIGTTGSTMSRAESAHRVGQRRRRTHAAPSSDANTARPSDCPSCPTYSKATTAARSSNTRPVVVAVVLPSISVFVAQQAGESQSRGMLGFGRISSDPASTFGHCGAIASTSGANVMSKKHVAVVGVIDDVGDLIGKEARIDRVAARAPKPVTP